MGDFYRYIGFQWRTVRLSGGKLEKDAKSWTQFPLQNPLDFFRIMEAKTVNEFPMEVVIDVGAMLSGQQSFKKFLVFETSNALLAFINSAEDAGDFHLICKIQFLNWVSDLFKNDDRVERGTRRFVSHREQNLDGYVGFQWRTIKVRYSKIEREVHSWSLFPLHKSLDFILMMEAKSVCEFPLEIQVDTTAKTFGVPSFRVYIVFIDLSSLYEFKTRTTDAAGTHLTTKVQFLNWISRYFSRDENNSNNSNVLLASVAKQSLAVSVVDNTNTNVATKPCKIGGVFGANSTNYALRNQFLISPNAYINDARLTFLRNNYVTDFLGYKGFHSHAATIQAAATGLGFPELARIWCSKVMDEGKKVFRKLTEKEVRYLNFIEEARMEVLLKFLKVPPDTNLQEMDCEQQFYLRCMAYASKTWTDTTLEFVYLKLR